jgi:hypothetical protein
MSNLRREADCAGNWSRVQGVATEQVITEGITVLHRITATNANGSVQTITVADGPSSISANILGVYELPVDDSRTLDFHLKLNTGLTITPSDAGIDALVIFDARLVATSGTGADLTIDVVDAISVTELSTVPHLFNLAMSVTDAVTLAEPAANVIVILSLRINLEDAVTVGQALTIPNLFDLTINVEDAVTMAEVFNVSII